MEATGAASDQRNPAIMPAWAVGFIAAVVYFLTSARGITAVHMSQDSGELAACAATLGIPHPTGYPLYMLLGRLAILVLPMLEPARVMVLLSVVSSAIAIGIIARTSALAIQLIWKNDEISPSAAGWWGALGGGFALVNPTLWSQAVVCEVYSVAVLLQALGWYFLARHLHRSEFDDREGMEKALIGLGFVLGLILSHHIAGAMLILPVLIGLLVCRRRIPFGDLGKAVLAVIPGLALYLYLPIRSLQNPRWDWGNPETLSNFIDHVTGRQYQNLVFGAYRDEFFWRVKAFGWVEYWGLIAVLVFLVGLIAFLQRERRSAGRALAIAVPVYVIWTIAFASGYRVTDYRIFLYPLAATFPIMIAPGLALLSAIMGRVSRFLPWLLALIVAATLVNTAYYRWVDMDSSSEVSGLAGFAFRESRVLPEDSLVITSTDGHLFSLMYAVTCGISDPVTGERLGPRGDVDLVASSWLGREWFRENIENRYGQNGRLKYTPSGSDPDAELCALVAQNLDHRPVLVDGHVLQSLRRECRGIETSSEAALFRVLSMDCEP